MSTPFARLFRQTIESGLHVRLQKVLRDGDQAFRGQAMSLMFGRSISLEQNSSSVAMACWQCRRRSPQRHGRKASRADTTSNLLERSFCGI